MAEGRDIQWVEITAAHAGQRIDNFLHTRLKGVPRTLVYRIVRKGEVRVNKKRVKVDYRLELNDLVRVPPLRLALVLAVPLHPRLVRKDVLNHERVDVDQGNLEQVKAQEARGYQFGACTCDRAGLSECGIAAACGK